VTTTVQGPANSRLHRFDRSYLYLKDDLLKIYAPMLSRHRGVMLLYRLINFIPILQEDLVVAGSVIPSYKWKTPCMAKLDRLGWVDGFSFTMHGVRVGVRVNKSEVLENLIELLPDGWKPANYKIVEQLYSLKIGGVSVRPNIRQFNLLYGNLYTLSRTLELDKVFGAFQRDLHHSIAFLAKHKVFVRAGVVGWQGRAILIVGKDESGKTKLVKELLKAGASYYSDEYAMLDSRGRVHPYVGLMNEFEGAQIGKKPLPVSKILMTGYKAESRFRPRRLSAGQAALELLPHIAATRRMPQTTLTFLQKAVSQAQSFKGIRGEAHEAAEYLLGSRP
jgi:hypothetical protein